MWCAKWRIKLNPVKTKVIIFSRSALATNIWRDTTYLCSSEISRHYFRLSTQLQKHFEDILDRCNPRYHRLRLLVHKKWGPSPATIIQIYKQCVRPIFEYGSVSTITASDNIVSKIQRLQNKFIRLPFVYQNTSAVSYFMTPLAFHM